MLALCSRLALAALCAWSWIAPAAAQDTRAAEVALAHGDFDKALQLVRSAIEAGTRTGAELSPLYGLEARAHAGLHEAEGTLRAFTCLLALSPEFRLEKGASPELRGPYVEARRFWTQHGTRLEALPRLADDLSGLVVAMNDPTEMVTLMRVRVRLLGKQLFSEEVRPPDDRNLVALPGLKDVRAVEYSVALYDEYGNRIWERGSDVKPERLDAPVPVIAATLDEPSAAPVAEAPRSLAWLIGGGVALGLGAGAVAGGAVVHAKQGFGSTAGVLYGVGGASLITGVVLLLVAPRRGRAPQSAALACHEGPGVVGVACTLGF
jgi:hypothetical protein